MTENLIILLAYTTAICVFLLAGESMLYIIRYLINRKVLIAKHLRSQREH